MKKQLWPLMTFEMCVIEFHKVVQYYSRQLTMCYISFRTSSVFTVQCPLQWWITWSIIQGLLASNSYIVQTDEACNFIPPWVVHFFLVCWQKPSGARTHISAVAYLSYSSANSLSYFHFLQELHWNTDNLCMWGKEWNSSAGGHFDTLKVACVWKGLMIFVGW